MHDVAVRIGMPDWRDWLVRVADTRTLRWLELPADVLEPAGAAELRLVDHLGLAWLHVADAIPANLSRYASESGLSAHPAALAALSQALRQRLQGRTRSLSLDLGLDRLPVEGVEAGLQRRGHFLRALVAGLEATSITLAVRVRVPRPFAGSHEWEWAGNLLHDVAHAQVGLALDVAMSDLPEEFEVESLLRECAAHLAVVRLHFRWRWGESPAEAVWQRWCGALRHQPGRLAVVFCPHEPPLAVATALLQDVERWAEPLTGEYGRTAPAARPTG